MVSRQDVLHLPKLIRPYLMMMGSLLVLNLGMGFLMSRLFHIQLRESMLTLPPAGATEMALIAAGLGVESANLVVLQLCRLVGVMVLFPHIFRAIVLLCA
ncbi:MAG: AbrB family transcriptional regulator [Lawsonibacter sp.]|nr:AbrB family transcriptional regulator [Lawsonibacter sp.]